MFSKYIYIVGLLGFLGIGIYIYFLKADISSLEDKVSMLQSKNVACNISNNNLKESILNQNKRIAKFNITVATKEKELKTINTNNQKLQTKLERELASINQVKTNTCEETVDWMLEEAISETIPIIAN